MSDTVIRLIERRSVGDKYILVSINILTFLFSNTPFLYFCSVQIGGMVATCVFMFVVLRYFTWLLTWPSSTTALWFTNICLKTIPDMESWGECVWKYTPNFECYILNSEGNLPQVFLIPLFGTYPSIKLCCSDLCGLGKFIQSQCLQGDILPRFRCYSEVRPESYLVFAPVVCPGIQWVQPAVFTPGAQETVLAVFHTLVLFVSDGETKQGAPAASKRHFLKENNF